jgi:threonine dehydrogenase-like Zn-dependent dehydrogenase
VVPGLALMKNLRVTFSCSADPAALDTVLKALVNGEVDAESWITRRVGLDGIAGAFESLRDPARTIAIVVEP